MNIKVWWICKRCKKEWKTSVNTRTTNCPEGLCRSCKNMKKENSLAVKRPDLAIQWDFQNNILKPCHISHKSNKKFWWVCNHCTHSFKMAVNNRVRRKDNNCPKCNGRVLNDKNRLSIVNPELAKEWDYNKNKLTPKDVFIRSGVKYWWICPQGHSFKATPANRTKK